MSQLTWIRVIKGQSIALTILTFAELLYLSEINNFISNYFPFLILFFLVMIYLSYLIVKKTSKQIGSTINEQKKINVKVLVGASLMSYVISILYKRPYGHDLILFLNTMALVAMLSMIGFSVLYKYEKILTLLRVGHRKTVYK